MESTLRVMVVSAALVLTGVTHPGLAQDGAPEPGAIEDVAEEKAVEETVAKKECHLFGVTWDGGSKRGALERAQSGLRGVIAKWRAEQGRNSGWRSDGVTIEAHQMKPNPYWRSRVKSHLYYRPNVRTATSYTVCWKGVISTAVCTSGAKVCK